MHPSTKRIITFIQRFISTDKILNSESEEDKNENQKKNKLLNNDNNTNAKDDNKNILLEYMGDVDDRLFKESSNGKNFNSFIN